MKVDKLLKFTAFTMNVSVNTEMPMYGGTAAISLIT